MTRVFSLEQVRSAAESIPSAQDFEEATTGFGQSINKEIEQGTITGGMIYGSVAIRGYGITSDFDCVITPVDHSPRSQEALERVISATNPSGRIEVNPIMHSAGRLSSGRHEIDRFFGEHLRGPSRIVYGHDPAEHLRHDNHDAWTIIRTYIAHKKRSTAPAMTPSSPEHMQGLQRVLELPLAIGRKALRALDEVNGTSLATADSANRTLITPAVLDMFESLELNKTAETLLELNRTYKESLIAVLEGTATEKEYADLLAEIRFRGSDASEWLDKLDVVLKPRLNPIKSVL